MAACPPPGGGGTPPPTPTYTTTVSGKVITPAGNTVTQYDTATRLSVPSADAAKVWASTASTTKVAVKADGSYTLTVTHPGTFTINVDYPAGRDYKAGSPQSVTTTKAAHTQDIALKYGYTTTLSGNTALILPDGTPFARNGVSVIVYVEGREVGSTVSPTISGDPGTYLITFDHPGTFRAVASFEAQTGDYSPARYTDAIARHTINLN